MCLERERKLHRDISYTNVLLQESDSSQKLPTRVALIQTLGLTEIESQRSSLKCREGLLIDFDYGADLTQEPQQTTLAETTLVNEADKGEGEDDDDDKDKDKDKDKEQHGKQQQEDDNNECTHAGQAENSCVRTVRPATLIHVSH